MRIEDLIATKIAENKARNGYRPPMADDDLDDGYRYEDVESRIREHDAEQGRRGGPPEPERPPMRERLLSVADLANLPRLEPVVSQLLDFDTIVLAYGRRDSAKSFVAIDLLNSVASGTRWHGRTVTTATAIYVVAEGAAGLNPRFVAWRDCDRNLGTALPPEQLMILPEPVNLLNPAAVGEFATMAAEIGARLIIFDTLARCMVGGDENSAKDAGMAIEQLDVIRRRTSACIIVVHHSGKNLDNGARGSSAFEAACDTVLEIGMADNIVMITATKQKNHVAPNPIRLRLCSTGPSAVLEDYCYEDSELPESVIETLRALRDIETPDGVATGKWAVAVTTSPRSFYRHVKRLLDDSLIVSIGTGKVPKYLLTELGHEVTATTATVLS
jgi:hypothetical protein